MADEGTGTGDAGDGADADATSERIAELEASIERQKLALSKERTARKDASKLLKAFEGIDAEAAREALANAEEAAEAKAKAEGSLDEWKDKFVAKHQKEVDEKVARIAMLENALKESLVSDRLTQAISEAGFHDDYRKAARLELLAEHRPQMIEENGKFRAVFIDDVDGETPIGEFVKTWSQTDDAARYMPGSGASGGDAGGSNNRTKTGGKIIVDGSDPGAMGRYADKIASGEAEVQYQ